VQLLRIGEEADAGGAGGVGEFAVEGGAGVPPPGMH